MMNQIVRARRMVTVLAFTLTVMAVNVAPATAATVSDPIIDGLAGPLGLALGDDGSIYVGEAFGGKLTMVDPNGNRSVLVDVAGNEIAGVDARGRGRVVYTQTLFAGAPGEEAPPLDASLNRVRANGKTRTIASTQDFEIATNPDGGQTYGFVDAPQACIDQLPPFIPPVYTGIVESHPYAVAMDGGGYVVADAAGNNIVKVSAKGRVSNLAVLPPVPQEITQEIADQVLVDFGFSISECVGSTYHGEPVPTDVEVGPDGHYYVSTLPGFPEAPGAGAVWKVNSRTGALSPVATGLVGPVDIAVGGDGTIYVAELFAFQISTVVDGVVTPLTFIDSPGAIEIADDGTLYATTGVFGPNGAVVTITP
jgi:hypothetical protein